MYYICGVANFEGAKIVRYMYLCRFSFNVFTKNIQKLSSSKLSVYRGEHCRGKGKSTSSDS